MHPALLVLTAALSTAQADNYQCLKAEQGGIAPGTMLYGFLQKQALVALDRRLEVLEKIKTPEEARAYQKRHKDFFLQQLGGLPERTPLKARVVGTLQGDGYRLEKVIYESEPNHHVTGVVYLPASPPPYPGVIIACGHSFNGKVADGYQRVGILLAKNGIAALCYDPIGQGERYQVFGPAAPGVRHPAQAPTSRKQLAAIPGQPEFNPVEEHTLVGIGSILVGTNTARYRIWDGIRSLDYLASRPDIDPKRLGCTGNSGGGTLTSYLMALDDRIVCAAPACYLTTFRRLLDTGGPQDAEQNLFGQIAFGLDQGDYVLMRAPQPTVILAGTRDSTFDITGTWDIFRQAKRFYARFDYPERVSLVEADAPHGFTVQLRVGAVRWLRRWLLGKDDAITEPDFPVWTFEQLQCTPKGQVMLLEKERSVLDMNLELEKKLAPQRQAFWAQNPREKALEKVRSLAGVRALEVIPRAKPVKAGTIQRPGYRIDKLVLHTEPGILLPALAFVPSQPSGEATLYVHGQGKAADAGPDGPIARLVKQGQLVLAVDLRGLGETVGQRKRDWSRTLFGPNGQEFYLAYLLGQSLVGQRAEDVLTCGRFLAELAGAPNKGKLHLIGIGTAGLPALHAMALEPGVFSSLTLRQTLASWTTVLATPCPKDQLTSTVHAALQYYDLPDLVRSVGQGRIKVYDE